MNGLDVIVVGGGLAGSLVALGAARKGLSTALVSPLSHFQDLRTTMLMDEGICFLKEIGVWDSLQHAATPISAIKILDMTGSLISAPDAIFQSSEIGLESFGYNFSNHALMTILKQEISRNALIHCFDAVVDEVQVEEKEVSVLLSTGERMTSRLLVGSDGRHSHIRKKLCFGEKQWLYPQTALVFNFKHSIPHNGLCTELHKFPGTMTQVPMMDNCSGFVWIMEPQEAKLYMKIPLEELSRKMEQSLYSFLGAIEIITEVQSFPLSGMISHRFGQGRVILVGESAHSLPPICAQGFNLSMRDVIVLLDLIRNNQTSFKNVGDRFHAIRRGDIIKRVIGTDLFNRSLFSKYPFLQILRAGTCHALERITPLRHLVMRKSLFLSDL
ncbi:MAG: FAD-binding protein [Candidatus Liberibacter ctenarytainae]|uniref:FAD-binding protein n=1 Tax=Candidatus Liberibacter ctenarytainae TaxID=2020335 RepID=A0A937DLB5_9HYPH|nr:FAD-binding protein [Candidatus Liberibacter ctenarytainae]